MKEAAAAKDLADDEVKNVTKKLKDATIKLEELQKSDKVNCTNGYITCINSLQFQKNVVF